LMVLKTKTRAITKITTATVLKENSILCAFV
jgi:hypothetical protein